MKQIDTLTSELNRGYDQLACGGKIWIFDLYANVIL
jgi:hypothetical protein